MTVWKINGMEVGMVPMPSAEGPREGLGGAIDFVNDIHNYGIWYACTGEQFNVWIDEKFHSFVEWSTLAGIVVAFAFLMLGMFGWKKGSQGVYWTIAIYIVLRMVGAVVK